LFQNPIQENIKSE